ncbi:DUF1569 domain-containing protein [Cryomorphaceae bacterium]|nr:DUF1569 domain-containing protein [Cryomorphaceae bacterium]
MTPEEGKNIISKGIEGLRSIDPNTPPAFGVMTSVDMIRHLMGSLALTFYEKPVELEIPKDKVGKAQAFLAGPHMIRPGATKPVFYEELSPSVDEGEFSEWVDRLEAQYARTLDYVSSAPEDWQHAHPKFGTLDKDQWWLFQGKHFYHHLSQFGVFPRLTIWEGLPD